MAAPGPLAVVHEYIGAFNRGDVNAMAAAFAVPGFILDGMAPHVWQGPNAAREWYADVLREGKENDACGYAVTLGDPSHVFVTGDDAYVVAPATMSFTVHGRPVTQSVATFTAALRRLADGWRIAGWAW